MSHFISVKTKFRYREHLVSALIQLNLPPQVHEVAQALQGYYGTQVQYIAEIIVPGRTISSRADIGFKWTDATGGYEVIHDEEEWENLARAALGLTLEEISDFLRLYIRKRLTPEGIVIDVASIAAVAEYNPHSAL